MSEPSGAGRAATGTTREGTATARTEAGCPAPLRGFARDGRSCVVMGVVNVTSDSFSDGGRYLDPELAIAHGVRLHAAGADIIDVGGESTRPGAVRIDAATEAARVARSSAVWSRRACRPAWTPCAPLWPPRRSRPGCRW